MTRQDRTEFVEHWHKIWVDTRQSTKGVLFHEFLGIIEQQYK